MTPSCYPLDYLAPKLFTYYLWQPTIIQLAKTIPGDIWLSLDKNNHNHNSEHVMGLAKEQWHVVKYWQKKNHQLVWARDWSHLVSNESLSLLGECVCETSTQHQCPPTPLFRTSLPCTLHSNLVCLSLMLKDCLVHLVAMPKVVTKWEWKQAEMASYFFMGQTCKFRIVSFVLQDFIPKWT